MTSLVKMRSIVTSSWLPLVLLYCNALSVTVSVADILGNETDQLSLIAFKDRIAQDTQGVMNSWNSSIHFCEWQGVTCSDRHQRVIALNLGSRGLIGSISPYVGNLSFLRSINLQNNSLQGKLPQEFGRLFRLEEFIVSNNSFSDQIPSNLSYCSNLKNLSLSYNNLVGELPVEFGSLKKLVILRLYSNSLTGRIPDSYGNLSSLELLVLGRNSLYGSIPTSLVNLRRLTFFSLGQNMLSGIVPPLLYNISSLLSISVPLNQLEGSLPREPYLNLPNLHTFFVGGNRLSGPIPISFITNTSRLQKLDLSFNRLNGKVPTEVQVLKSLLALQLDANNFGDSEAGDLDFITSLSNCSNLLVLSISLNRFGGTLPSSIANLSSTVNSLYLGDNQISGTLPSEIRNLNNLMVLSLEVNLMTGIIPESIGMLSKLQILSLWRNRFSGQIPNSVGNTSLYQLDLSDNKLEGNISSLEKCRFLQIFNLSHNHLTSIIPTEVLVSLSSQLTTIILAHNSFTGPLPLEVGNLKNLRLLDISHNQISGEIPSELGSCLSLENLYLQNNFFQGFIPSTLSSLKILRQLDLSSNNLSGKILKNFEDMSFLNYLNLAFNGLEGEVPINGIFQNVSAFSVIGNDELCGGVSKLGLLQCHVQRSEKQGISLTAKIKLGIVVPLSIIASFLLILCSTKQCRIKSSPKEFLEYQRFSTNRLKIVTYNDLWKATNGFSSENLIGEGSCGSVYKGVLQGDDLPIAVKVLNLIERGASKSFVAECEVLRRVRHRNLLKIVTVCSSLDSKGNEFKALVFEFMSNGSMEDWLHPSSDRNEPSRNLNFLQRLNIAIDVASALDYLHNHCGTPIVHCDLKPSNVLLDDDMVACVSDFGLAKFLPKLNNSFERNGTNSASLRGTIGYIPPEYGMGVEASTEGDMYSYGILLLEMFTGKRPTDEMFKEGLGLHDFSKLVLSGKFMDKMALHIVFEGASRKAKSHSDKHFYTVDQTYECLMSMIKIGVACSSEPVAKRMDIDDVLTELHAVKKVYLSTEL